jgi:membrane protein YqaA with SNARE-associated domain
MIESLLEYGGLFFWSFLAATILPLSSEIPLAAMVHVHHSILLPVLIATAGNYLGACTTYWIGRRAAHAVSKESEPTAKQERAASLLRRFGQPALLLSWVPVLGDALVALSGAMKIPFLRFSLWVVLGKALRYLAVAWGASSIV